MSKKKKTGCLVWIVVLTVLLAGGFFVYQKFFKKIHLKNKNYTHIFIGRNDTFENVIDDINAEGIITDPETFEWLAKKMKLHENLHPGKYRIIDGMTMRQIINLVKYNKQEKVKLTYNFQIRNLEEFMDYTDEKLELSQGELEDFLWDEKKLSSFFKLDPDNSFALLVPGVYEVGWAISADELFGILKNKYDKIWNPERTAKAKKLGFTIPEVLTLASIVQCESHVGSEQEKIAGVYMNRLRKNMPLQADPTLKYANKNYEAARILNEDKGINSPYNTYKYKGLPPGPICLVGPQAIDATLNYKKHEYIFFCARPQLNGFSDFSSTYDQHCRYAKAYQRALDKMGISR